MGRKRKVRTRFDDIQRYLFRNYNQELSGQTKFKHYHATEFVECEICHATECKLHRHRIEPGKEYTDSNVVILCVKCHKLVHRIINELKTNDSKNMRLAILIAKTEYEHQKQKTHS
jgi:hypothetical protein